MKNTATDYKKLYEQSLENHQKTILVLEKNHTKVEQKVRQQLTEKDIIIAHQQTELDKLRKYIFGRKSEKLPAVKNTDPNQLSLFDLTITVEQQEKLSQEAAKKAASQKTPAKRAKGSGRMALPENLRREIITVEPQQDITGCTKIGEEVTEILDIIPAELYVKRIIRPKYLRPADGAILIGSLAERVIEKGIPSDKVIATMMTDKYVYGLPLHRQINKFRKMGINLPASTVSDWMIKGWQHLVPLWELLRQMITQHKYLQADETPLQVLDSNHPNGIHKGYIWAYNAPTEKLVLFDYRPGRNSTGPQDILGGFKGILQSDGFIVYESLYGNNADVMLIYCMAHARRKFVEARGYDKAKCDYVLEQMQLLYKLEKELRDSEANWEERTRMRQLHALPVLEGLKEWMKEQLPFVAPSSPLGKALQYTYPRWEGLSAYAYHSQIEIDNNLVENAIRPIAIGRKNYLFAGSPQAAQMTAAMYSFMASCKMNEVNEVEWLTDVLQRIQSIKHKNIYQLLPNNWKEYKSLQENTP